MMIRSLLALATSCGLLVSQAAADATMSPPGGRAVTVTGAAGASYTAPAGALVRVRPDDVATLAAKGWTTSTPLLLLQDMGAVGDGVADDTKALALALQSGRTIACDGKFKVTAPIITQVKLGSAYAIKGSGRQGCQIILSTKTARLEADIAGTPVGNAEPRTSGQVLLEDVTFTPTAAVTGNATDIQNAAFAIVQQPTGDGTSGKAVLRNVTVIGDSPLTWAKFGLYISLANELWVDGMRCVGARAYYYEGGSACIFIHGATPTDAAANQIPETLHFSHVAAFNENYALRTENHVEGLIFEDSVCVGDGVCLELDDSTTTGSIGAQVAFNEFNAVDGGVHAVGWTHMQFHHNHFAWSTSIPDSVSPFGISISGGSAESFAVIDHNWFDGGNRGTYQRASSAAPAAGGTGYAVHDTITDAAGVFTVTAVSRGAVTAVAATTPVGQLFPKPKNPLPQTATSGAGNGATLNVAYLPTQDRYGVIFNADSSTQASRSQVDNNVWNRIDVGTYLGANINNVEIGCNLSIQDGNSGFTLLPISDNSPETVSSQLNYQSCNRTPLRPGNNYPAMAVPKTPLGGTNANGWTNDAGQPPAVFKSADGYVSFAGIVDAGTTANPTLVTTLPPGIRPQTTLTLPAATSTGATVTLVINTDGTLYTHSPWPSGARWLSLDLIRFQT